MESDFTPNYDFLSKLKGIAVKETLDNPKVSIIVPTFNNAEFLVKCLFSLLKQTLREIEIIIINDGSTDNTSDILEAFRQDSRVIIINQDQQKQGAARNRGLKLAKGEYIGFVDSDDWIDLDYYEKLYNTAQKYNSDIALATNIRVGGNKKTKKRLCIDSEKFVTNLQDKFDICKQPQNPCPTNKIYRTSLLKDNNILFPEGVYYEDKIFTVKAVYYANGIVTVPGINYYYFRNPKSTVNSRDISKLEEMKRDKQNAYRAVLDFIKEKHAKIKDKAFWAIKNEFKIWGITIYQTKESTASERILLFGLIPIMEVKHK